MDDTNTQQKSATSRRGLLAAGAAAASAVALTAAAAGPAQAAAGRGATGVAVPGEVGRRLAELEREHGARLGVHARNLRTGRTVAHRADELFPMCSVFKTVAVAAVLRDLDRDGEFLARRLHYTEADTTASGGAPVTGLPQNLAHGMTVGELCAAAIDHSDNAAANLLLRELGGPTAVTRFCRSIGDGITRLDRWEPELNTAEPDRVTDTTTPRAIARTYRRLLLGRALEPADRRRLTGWLLGNTTSAHRFREGLPADWRLADKTGSGSYGTANDAGVTWTPSGAPIVLVVLTTRPEPTAPRDEALVARTASLLAATLG
ncbi:class A beta-lactamase [Kitasatospora sp. NPDC101183]|uniref:class A beta-lactamase n=1 Tax=Kitasatospora sp. NPDC101183 TaxID=3364100 RepID=UPI0037FD1F48